MGSYKHRLEARDGKRAAVEALLIDVEYLRPCTRHEEILLRVGTRDELIEAYKQVSVRWEEWKNIFETQEEMRKFINEAHEENSMAECEHPSHH